MKIMSKYTFDQSTDYSHRELYNMFMDVDIPEYVKKAEVDDAIELRSLPKTAFADPNRQIYPINTPARVFVSNAYFLDKKADIERLYGNDYVCQLQNSIDKAAEVFGISEDLTDYSKENNEKRAADYEPHCMMQFHVDGMSEPVELYPVKTAFDLGVAADSFARNIRKFPFDVRIKTAETMAKTAELLHVDELPDIVMKYAGMFYPDLGNLEAEIWRRSTKLQKEAHKKIYASMAKDLSNMTDVREVMKVAEVMHSIENMEGLFEKTAVAAILGDPVDKLFKFSVEKIASELAFIDVHGEKYKLSDLTKISKDTYEEAFGCDMDPSDTEKLAEMLPTMPRSDMALFEELSGIRPI